IHVYNTNFISTIKDGTDVNKKILIVIIIIIVVVALAIPFAIYTISPLFISNTVNEPLPTTAAVTNKNTASQEYQKFVSMNEQDRINAAKQMSQRQKNMVMIGAAQLNNTMNENVVMSAGTINKQQQQQQQSNATTTAASTIIRTGYFIGAGDGFHNAEGLAKVIPLEGVRNILRLESFKSTNGPNVHLYLATDKAASSFIDLGRLKANNGNQNYNIPVGIDLTKYNIALIWCKDFSVLFGSAQLKT
ncbi:MAG: DM13 domain-containing protein, partial [Nitrososphaeraceae archaeon]